MKSSLNHPEEALVARVRRVGDLSEMIIWLWINTYENTMFSGLMWDEHP
jgi:hypothetical protein